MIERYSRPEMSKIWLDEIKFEKMLLIEILACEAHSKLGAIPKREFSQIKKKARFNLDNIKKIEEQTQHDVVAFVKDVEKSVGLQAKYIHMGLTSSDVLDTGLVLQLREASSILIKDVEDLIVLLRQKAIRYKDMVCIGRTHGVHAEPITLGLKFALWLEEMKRNLVRLKAATDVVSVGKISGAVGTYSNINPFVEKYICEKLNLKVASVSTQVIQRDRFAEYLGTLAIIGASLEKMALEIRHLQRTEVREVEEPFKRGQKGSSAMPHKRNPVICERICGLARVLRGNSTAALENVALWHERDISHSSVERVIIPDSTILLDYMLAKFIEVIKGLLVYPDNMLANLAKTKGLIFSQRVLVTLMNKGLERSVAYDIVQRAAMNTWKETQDFKANLIKEGVLKYLSEKELCAIFDLNYYLRNLKTIYRRIGLK